MNSELETPNRVVVTGLGVVSPAGDGREEFDEGVVSGEVFAGESTLVGPAASESTPRVCEVSAFNIRDYLPTVRTYVDRASALSLAAAKLALDDAALAEKSLRPSPVGLSYATEWGCLDSMRLFFSKVRLGRLRAAPALPFSHSYPNSPTSITAIELGLEGYGSTFSCGRTSSAHAMLSAADAIRRGAARCIVAGGSEALSEPRYRHHLAKGDGTMLGEAGAFLVLEEMQAAESRNARALATLVAGCVGGGGHAAVDALETLVRKDAPAQDAALYSCAGDEEAAQRDRSVFGAAGLLSGGREVDSPGARLGDTEGAACAVVSAAAVAAIAAGRTRQAVVLCSEEDNAVAFLFGCSEG